MKTIFGIGVAFALIAVMAMLGGNDTATAAAAVAGWFAAAFLFMSFGVWLWKVMDD